MSPYTWLAVYCLLILLISLSGGSLPLLGRISHRRLQFYLSASAGVMLGAAFFHIIPDAVELAGESFGLWMAIGVVGIFCIERFIAPHSHETDEQHHQHHHPHKHEHAAEPEGKGEPVPKQPAKEHQAAPAVAGWMAVLGLTIHTLMNGVGLAGAVDAAFQEEDHHRAGVAVAATGSAAGADADLQARGLAPAKLFLPGLAMFLAIFLHKPADALAISVVLSRKGVKRRRITLVQLGFALMVPVGVVVYYLIKREIGHHGSALEKQLAGAALAFSAGTFLLIALSDLLPEVQFHQHDRVPLFLTLIAGVVLMGGIAFLEEHHHVGADHHGAHEEGQTDDDDKD